MKSKKMILLPLKIRKEEKINDFMLKRFLTIVISVTIISLVPFSGNAQRTMEVGVFGGGSYYLGDINPALHFSQTQLAYGGIVRYNLNDRWTVRASYYRGKLKGDDTKTNAIVNRELNFVTPVNDISVVAEFSWFQYFTGSKRTYFTPYLFAGVSYFTFKPENNDGVALQPLGTEGQNTGFNGRSPYSLSGLSFPFGFGVKYSLNKRIGLAFEWGMRKTFTDYIDDVSSTYANNPDIIADPTQSHSAGMQRGDDKKNDWYNFTGITITYKFNLFDKRKCNTTGF
ncbi:MAG: hypothetical protein C0598_04380 [Marinilabiliales bacterium]|nr:MAG: hypothetical protein C0598_04380 [Marinilabiliales bacterium]